MAQPRRRQTPQSRQGFFRSDPQGAEEKTLRKPKRSTLEMVIKGAALALIAGSIFQKSGLLEQILKAENLEISGFSTEPFVHKCKPLPLIHRCPSCGEYVKAD